MGGGSLIKTAGAVDQTNIPVKISTLIIYVSIKAANKTFPEK